MTTTNVQSGPRGNIYVHYGWQALLLTLLLGLVFWRTMRVEPLLSYLLGINLATLSFFARDKSAAQQGLFRIPERLFYSLALFGGAPGILLGMKVFRHKTKKRSFQFFLLLTIVVQGVLVHWFGAQMGWWV